MKKKFHDLNEQYFINLWGGESYPINPDLIPKRLHFFGEISFPVGDKEKFIYSYFTLAGLHEQVKHIREQEHRVAIIYFYDPKYKSIDSMPFEVWKNEE